MDSTTLNAGVSTNINLVNSVIPVSQATTVFIEAEGSVKSDFMTPVMPNNTIHSRLDTIKDFLAKPALVDSVQWNTAVASGSPIFTGKNIADFLKPVTGISEWLDKIVGFNLIRGTFVLRIEMNASPFQAGMGLLHYIPYYQNILVTDPKFAKRNNALLITKMQHPHILVDVRDTTAEFRIPYIAPTTYCDIADTKFANPQYDWGTIFFDCVSPIVTGTSVTQDYVEFQVYAYWENIDLVAPCYPQMSDKAIKRSRGVSSEVKEFKGPISSGLMKVAKVGDILATIPMISREMNVMSWASRILANVASVMGWSKPRVDTQPNPVYRQNLRYIGVSEGADVSVPLALSYDNQTRVSDSYSINKEDEMSLKFLLDIPTYIGNYEWTVARPFDYQLITPLVLGPNYFYQDVTEVVGIHTARYRNGAPLWYLSEFFNEWRGGFKLIIKVVKTQFHSGRLQVTFTPNADALNIPNCSQSLYSLRQIIDIREQDYIELDLPWMMNFPYFNSRTGPLPDNMGKVDVRVLNPLRCPETVGQQVNLLFFIKAADDFEFQVPCAMARYPGVYDPQMSDTVIVSEGIGGESSSFLTTDNSSMCIGEHFTSIKQLLNRASKLKFRFVLAGNDSYTIYPYNASTITLDALGILATTDTFGDMFSYMAPMYMWFRGGARLTVQGTGVTAANLAPGALASVSSVFPGRVNIDTTAQLGASSIAQHLYYPGMSVVPCDSDVGTISYQIPYYCTTPISPVRCWNGTEISTKFHQHDIPSSNITLTNYNLFEDPFVLQRSFLDDFQLSFFLNAPPLLVFYS